MHTKMRLRGWRNVVKVAGCAVVYIIIIFVYLKSLQQNKRVWSQFSLKKTPKMKHAQLQPPPPPMKTLQLDHVNWREKTKVGAPDLETVKTVFSEKKVTKKNGTDQDQWSSMKKVSKDKKVIKNNRDYINHGGNSSVKNVSKDKKVIKKNGTYLDHGGNNSKKVLEAVKREPMDVFVVEEHHEVIPYWLGAAEHGLIPKHGNTLIHIDGHNDLGPPLYLPGYPFFRWPNTFEEMRFLMQRNDAFIQAAAMTGLLERAIWVWPSWDKINHEQEYVAANLSLGWFKPRQPRGETAFCMCVRNDTGTSDCRTFMEHDSYIYNDTREGPVKPFEGFPVPFRKCKIEKTIWVEEVSDTIALKLIGKAKWLRDAKNVFLDIDEDYFGCTYAIRPLLDANISLDIIESFDEFLGAVFCPETFEHDKESDNIIQDILQKIRKAKGCPDKHKKAKGCNSVFQLANITDTAQTIAGTLHKLHKLNKIRICNSTYHNGSVLVLLKAFVYHISRLKSKQIQQLQYVGFCSETSPLTMIPDYERHFGLCSGANSPNKTVVLEHRPSEQEISLRSRLLAGILKKLRPTSPKMATVCRSVRDGYTPRAMFDKIEALVLNGLNQTYNVNVTYDSRLIGGKGGWPSAHIKKMH